MSPDLHRYIDAAWLLIIIVWIAGAFSTKRSVRKQSRASRLIQIAEALIVVELFIRGSRYLPWFNARFVPKAPSAAWTGLLLTYAGIAFVIAARVHLGRNWSGTVTVKQDHTLIRGGPYSVVHHPIYSGFLLAALGTAVYNGQVRSLVAVTLAAVVMLQKIYLEEKFMTEQFGGQYLSYKHEVKRLIPYVW